jgi:phage shock protein E
MLENQAAEQLPDKDARIVTHCGAGGRGSLAAKSLKEMPTRTWPTWTAA